MSFNYTTCVACHQTQEFYGRFVPPCPKCGFPELKTSAEYYKAMGVKAHRGTFYQKRKL